MNSKATIEAVQRLLDKKQAIPTQLVRDLLIELRTFKGLYELSQKKIAELTAQPAEEAVTS